MARRRPRRRPDVLMVLYAGKGMPMLGETDLHNKTLKKEGCRWLNRMGYRYIAAAGDHQRGGDGDDRAIASVNREIFSQQMQLAERIRSIRPAIPEIQNADK